MVKKAFPFLEGKITSVDHDRLKLLRVGELREWVIKFERVRSYINLFATFFSKCLESETGSVVC